MDPTAHWQPFREQFPALENRVYLNTAGGGAVSKQAAAAGIQYYQEAVEHADTYWDTWLNRSDGIRRDIAAFIGIDAASVAFIQNTSLGFNLVARQFNRPLAVLALDREFPSCTTPWLAAGHDVRFFPSNDDGSITAELVDHHLHSGIDILVLSSVQFADGYRSDLKAIGDVCKDRGIFFVVDATQSICAYEINMQRDHIDGLIFSGYKWATAGYGNAVLAANAALRDQAFGEGLIGWRSASEPYLLENNSIDLTNSAIRYEMGHPSFPSVFTLGAAVKLFQETGIQDVSNRITSLSQRLRAGCISQGWAIASDTEKRGSITSTSGITLVKTGLAGSLAARLQQDGVWTSARAGGLRVSVHAYNTESEVDRFLEALGAP